MIDKWKNFIHVDRRQESYGYGTERSGTFGVARKINLSLQETVQPLQYFVSAGLYPSIPEFALPFCGSSAVWLRVLSSRKIYQGLDKERATITSCSKAGMASLRGLLLKEIKIFAAR